MRSADRGNDLWGVRRGALSSGIPRLDAESPWSQAIEGMLREQSGIHSVKVALLAERGVVEYDPKTWDPEKIISVCRRPLVVRTWLIAFHCRKYPTLGSTLR